MTIPTRPLTRDALVEDLTAVWSSLDGLLADLDDDQWSRPTACPGWDVQDVVSHVIGVESLLAGRPAPDVEVPDAPHLRNDMGRMNEAWVVERRDRSPAEVLAELRDIVAERTAALLAMSDEEFEAPSWTPAGQATYGRFMQIRVFDQWIHELDIREAVGRPGHLTGPAVLRTLAEIALGVGYVVGKLAQAPEGSSVRFEVTGPEAATFDVVVEGRARLADEPVAAPTVTIRCDTPTFVQLVAGRIDAVGARDAGRVQVLGDEDLAARVLANIDYVI